MQRRWNPSIVLVDMTAAKYIVVGWRMRAGVEWYRLCRRVWIRCRLARYRRCIRAGTLIISIDQWYEQITYLGSRRDPSRKSQKRMYRTSDLRWYW
jgi:hypothetical protein